MSRFLARKLPPEVVKLRRSMAAKERQKSPERREQKRLAQMKYVASPKAILTTFKRWASRRKNEIKVTDDQLLALREQPCHSCGNKIQGIGNGFILIYPRRAIELSNMLPTCGICKLIKPKDAFSWEKFSKDLLRRYWKKTPMASIAKQRARKSRGQYQCAKCLKLFKEKETQLDHIVPVVDPIQGYKDLDTFARRLFCDDSNLQILCIPCHEEKTGSENASRNKRRNKK